LSSRLSIDTETPLWQLSVGWRTPSSPDPGEPVGRIEPGTRSEPLALSELILLFHMLRVQAVATAGAAHA